MGQGRRKGEKWERETIRMTDKDKGKEYSGIQCIKKKGSRMWKRKGERLEMCSKRDQKKSFVTEIHSGFFFLH